MYSITISQDNKYILYFMVGEPRCTSRYMKAREGRGSTSARLPSGSHQNQDADFSPAYWFPPSHIWTRTKEQHIVPTLHPVACGDFPVFGDDGHMDISVV